MKRVHIISIGDSRLCDLAISFAQQGHQVTCSGVDLMEPVKEKLAAYNLMPLEEGWFPEVLTKDYDIVIPANDLDQNNPEFLRAKELSLLVLSFPEYVYTRFRNKTRILVSGSHHQDSIISMISYTLHQSHILFDYVYSQESVDKPALNWGYDARIALMQDDATFSPYINKQINDYYRPHILVISCVDDLQGMVGFNVDQKRQQLKQLVASIERDGKFIYNQEESLLEEVAQLVREDITAMPYTIHQTKEDDKTLLISRFGEYRLGRSDEKFLSNLNAARLACRQLGLNDRNFYEYISQYSLKA